MTRFVTLVALLPILAMVALGQPADDDRPRFRGPPGGPGGPGGMGGERMFDRVVDELKLDEAQKVQFEEIVAPFREQMRQGRERMFEIRQALEAGDDAKVQELRANFSGFRGMADGAGEIFDALEPILREDQLPRMQEMRTRFDEQVRTRETWRQIERELPDELNLDDQQREEFDQLLEEQRRAAGAAWGPVGAKWRELRQAQEDGDDERAKALRAEIDELRPRPEVQVEEFLTALDGVLKADQKPLLAAYRDQLAPALEAPGKPDPQDVRSIIRAAQRAGLKEQQRDDLRKIEREAMKELSAIRREGGDAEGKAMLAAQTKEKIERLLDESQREKFSQQLERMTRSKSRG